MGVTNRQGPIYILPSTSQKYRDEHDRIFGKKKKAADNEQPAPSAKKNTKKKSK